MTFNFGEVLARAWQITWKYKVLWIFGILAGCAQGGGGSSGSGVRGSGDGNNPLPQNYQQYLDQASRWLTENWWVLILAFVVMLLFILLFVFLGTIGRIGLIRGTLQAETGAEPLVFGQLFSESTPFFWRIFALGLAFGLVFFLLFFTLIISGILTAGIGFVCLAPIICLLVPIAWVANLVLEQAYVAIVKENLGIVDGWKRGWQVARENIGPILIMALILFAISFVASLIIAIPIIAIVVPAGITFALGNQQNMTPILLAGLCFVAYLPVLILVKGILATFTGSSWTLTFLRLTATPTASAPVVVEGNA